MLGGMRLKAIGLLTNIAELQALGEFVCGDHSGMCDRTGRPHLSWGPQLSSGGSEIEYQTEAEAEYP